MLVMAEFGMLGGMVTGIHTRFIGVAVDFQYTMSEYPGLPRVIGVYWALIGVLIAFTAIAHAIFILPVTIGAVVFAPVLFDYIVFAFIGWTVLYTIDTLSLFKYINIQHMMDEITTMPFQEKAVLYGLIALYINVVIAIAALLGYASAQFFSSGLIGFALLLLYPNLDLQLAPRTGSPGMLALSIVLTGFHTIGVLTDVRPSTVVQSLSISNQQVTH